MKCLNRHFFLSLWFFWFFITLIYLLTFFTGGWVRGNWNYGINNILGFFTPMGFGNLVGSIAQHYNPHTTIESFLLTANHNYKWIITFPLLFLTLFIGDKIGKKFIPSPIVRVIYNLTILVFLTMVLDWFIWGHWFSLSNFLAVFLNYN